MQGVGARAGAGARAGNLKVLCGYSAVLCCHNCRRKPLLQVADSKCTLWAGHCRGCIIPGVPVMVVTDFYPLLWWQTSTRYGGDRLLPVMVVTDFYMLWVGHSRGCNIPRSTCYGAAQKYLLWGCSEVPVMSLYRACYYVVILSYTGDVLVAWSAFVQTFCSVIISVLL